MAEKSPKKKKSLEHFFSIFFNLLWTLWSFLGGDIYPIISRGILLEKHKFQQESLSLWLQRHSSRIDRCRNRFHRTRSKWIFFFSKFYGKVGKTRPATTIGILTCWRNFNIFRRLYSISRSQLWFILYLIQKIAFYTEILIQTVELCFTHEKWSKNNFSLSKLQCWKLLFFRTGYAFKPYSGNEMAFSQKSYYW